MTQRPYELDLYAARNRQRAYEAVVAALETAAPPMTRKAIAASIGRKPSQISLTLSGPSNWTLDTVSDLLRAVGATMEYRVEYDADRPRANRFNSVTVQATGAGATATPPSATAHPSSATNASATVATLMTFESDR